MGRLGLGSSDCACCSFCFRIFFFQALLLPDVVLDDILQDLDMKQSIVSKFAADVRGDRRRRRRVTAKDTAILKQRVRWSRQVTP